MSFAKTFAKLSIPYVTILLSGNNLGIFAACKSSALTIPVLHISNNFNFELK